MSFFCADCAEEMISSLIRGAHLLSANTFWIIFISCLFRASARHTLPADAARSVLALTALIVDKEAGVCGMYFLKG